MSFDKGFSVIEAVKKQFLSDMNAIGWNLNFFKNNGNAGTIFSTDKSIDTEKQRRFLEMYKSEFR